MYDYKAALKDDIKFVSQDYEWGEAILTQYLKEDEDISELRDKMYEDLWDDDSVTGNGSGSYTFNREDAKNYVLENMNLLHDACIDFDCDPELIGKKFLEEDWEWFDVTIRCSLLGIAIEELLDEIFDN